jgi:prolipoprotein diacylglyceryltransferase
MIWGVIMTLAVVAAVAQARRRARRRRQWDEADALDL